MRKRFFMIALAFLLALPGVVFLTACGESSPTNAQIADLYIRIGGSESQNHIITSEYGQRWGQITNDIYEDSKFIVKYTDGTSKELSSDNYSEEELKEFEKKWKVSFLNSQGQSVDEPSSDDILDIGYYYMDFSLDNHTARITIEIVKAEAQQKTLNIVILENEDTNYSAKLNTKSIYEYGTTNIENEEQDGFDAEGNPTTYLISKYNSPYKAYVVDQTQSSANRLVSGTKVNEIYALPEISNVISQGEFNVDEGTNLKEYYDNISVEGEDGQIDAAATFARKQLFLEFFGIKISEGKYSDDALVINTNALMPGEYYTFAKIEDENYETSYSLISNNSSRLQVKKAKFSFKNSLKINEGSQWNSVDEVIDALELSYTFWMGNSNGKTTTATSKALTTAYLNEYMKNSYAGVNDKSGLDFSDVDSVLLGGGREMFGWGHFEFVEKQNNVNIGLDAEDSGETFKAVFVLDNGTEFYDVDYDETYDVVVTINKGILQAPTLNGEKYQYTGEQIDANILNYDPADEIFAKLVNVTGNLNGTNVGDYQVTFTLADTINYEFDCTADTAITLSWEIEKLNLYFTNEITYNGEVNESSIIDYVAGQRTITIRPEGNTAFDLLREKYPSTAVVWALNGDYGTDVILTQSGDSAIITINTFSGTNIGVNLVMTIEETGISNEVEHNVYIGINKANYTETEKQNILDEMNIQTETDEYGNVTYVAPTIRVSEVSLTLPDVLPNYEDTTNPPATESLGMWKLYHYEDDQYVEKHNGDSVDLGDWYGWSLAFVPADNMYVGIDYVGANIEFYKEDIPDETIDVLKDELQTKTGYSFSKNQQGEYVSEATFEIEARQDIGYGSYDDILPAHDNEEEGAFQGQWVLCFDYRLPDGETISDIELTFPSHHSFTEDVTEEWVKSPDRNWRIKFIPTSNAYNTIEIKVNVSVS